MPGTSFLLTPQGRGAVATVLVMGPGAREAVGKFFSPAGRLPWMATPVDRVRFGRFHFSGVAGEELVVCPIQVPPADSSATQQSLVRGPSQGPSPDLSRERQEAVEIHCHGGHAAAGSIQAALASAGFPPGDPREWTGQQGTTIQAEARAALSDAQTVRTASILLDQHRGALDRAFEELEYLERSRDPAAAGRLRATLQERGRWGIRLTTGWRIVLLGEPNVGKSSLMNRILGFSRALVSERAGTTRDVLTADAAIDGWPVELFDVAGLRVDTPDPLEQAGMARALASAEQADVVLLVVDGSQPATPWEHLGRVQFPEAIGVANKLDLGFSPERIGGHSFAVSARTGDGLEPLLAAISLRLVPDPPSPGAPVPFTQRQLESLVPRSSD